MNSPLPQRRVIAGDAFQRIVRRGDWIWFHRKPQFVYPGVAEGSGDPSPSDSPDTAPAAPVDVQT